MSADPTKLRRTYKHRIYPTGKQAAALTAQLGQACDLYNAALQHRRDMWRDHGVSVSFYDQSGELKHMRAEGLLDAGVSSKSQQRVLRRLDKAFAAFFRRVKAGEKPGHPRFKARQHFNTLTWDFGWGCALKNGRLKLQRVGHVKVRWHRQIPTEATIKTVSVKRQGNRWYACFDLDNLPANPLPKTGRSVGVDLGIQTFAALSTGELIAGPRANREAAKAVRRAARRVARRKRGSNRRRKAAALLARQHEREANRRRDHAHKTARDLIERFDVIAVEDLNVRGLAKGMLAKDCNDQGWASFVALLDQKAECAARRVVRVDARNTSRTCPDCGAVAPKALSQRVHSCACGCTLDRDVAAAKVVLHRGLGCSLQAKTVGAEVRAVA